MKTDHELLELAAKAAGIKIERRADGRTFRKEKGFPFSWNPLEDDGDAFRLAVAFQMQLDLEKRDNMSDVRRDIVRAAAAIGEGME